MPAACPIPLRIRLVVVTLAPCMCLALLSGCGAGRGDVRGRVTYRGKPLRLGDVMVVGSDSLAYYGQIKEDGTYLVRGVACGPARLAVDSPDPRADGLARRRQKSGRPQLPAKLEKIHGVKLPARSRSEPPKADAGKWFAIPRRYGSHETSGLTLTVGRGNNAHDIDLK